MSKNLLYPNSSFSHIKGSKNLIFAAFLWPYFFFSQIGNYVNNGSFELKYTCNPPYSLDKAKYWSSIGNDTTKFAGYLYSVDCFFNAPYTDVGFQYPHGGETFYRLTPFCTNPCPYYGSRSYPRNRLKSILISNKTYCVKMHVSRQDACPYAISNFGFFFANNTIDTITYCNNPLTYIIPQVTNPTTNIIIDTLNWVSITGTFVATGAEKYLVIGNFDSNAITTNSLVDSSYGNGVWAEYFVDDVSCIEFDLPAYAGPDRSVIPGDSVYIGRELDFAIDSGCTWYKLPNQTTPLVKASGLWIKPTTTSTYVVKQVLECSPLKSDTVVVYMNPLGLVSSSAVENDLKLFPNPTQNRIQIQCSSEATTEFTQLSIYNNLGQLVKKAEIIYKNKTEFITVDELENGIYFVSIANTKNERVVKKLIISK